MGVIMEILPIEKRLELNSLIAKILSKGVSKMVEKPWHPETIATSSLIDPMMDDIGIEDPVIRAAVKSYCCRLIGEALITMADLSQWAVCYFEGFQAGYAVYR
jgi:hypothetical protein